MTMFRTVCRGLLTSSVVAFLISGCSFSFGSGGSSSSNNPWGYGAGAGRPLSQNFDNVDDREKPLPSSHDKAIPKATGPHRTPTADPTPAPTRDKPTTHAPKRTKPAPKRIKPATRTPAPTRTKPTSTKPSRDGDRTPTASRPQRSSTGIPTRRVSKEPRATGA